MRTCNRRISRQNQEYAKLEHFNVRAQRPHLTVRSPTAYDLWVLNRSWAHRHFGRGKKDDMPTRRLILGWDRLKPELCLCQVWAAFGQLLGGGSAIVWLRSCAHAHTPPKRQPCQRQAEVLEPPQELEALVAHALLSARSEGPTLLATVRRTALAPRPEIVGDIGQKMCVGRISCGPEESSTGSGADLPVIGGTLETPISKINNTEARPSRWKRRSNNTAWSCILVLPVLWGGHSTNERGFRPCGSYMSCHVGVTLPRVRAPPDHVLGLRRPRKV